MKNNVFLLIIPLLSLFSKNAFAYLDPGAGSMLLQALLGLIAAALYIIKMYWINILNWFKKSKREES